MNRKGFTLIELLIVVAIIAILAAIAVPNFLEAQIRSKTSRARADMRSTATAMEAYVVDNNGYPPMGDKVPTQRWDPLMAEPILHSRISSYLTTPIAYISSLTYDPFIELSHAQLAHPFIYRRYTYFNYKQFEDNYPTSTTFPRHIRRAGYWIIYSWGPDKSDNQAASPKPAEDGVYTNYDATNGTISYGNVIRTQKNPEKYNRLAAD